MVRLLARRQSLEQPLSDNRFQHVGRKAEGGDDERKIASRPTSATPDQKQLADQRCDQRQPDDLRIEEPE